MSYKAGIVALLVFFSAGVFFFSQHTTQPGSIAFTTQSETCSINSVAENAYVMNISHNFDESSVLYLRSDWYPINYVANKGMGNTYIPDYINVDHSKGGRKNRYLGYKKYNLCAGSFDVCDTNCSGNRCRIGKGAIQTPWGVLEEVANIWISPYDDPYDPYQIEPGIMKFTYQGGGAAQGNAGGIQLHAIPLFNNSGCGCGSCKIPGNKKDDDDGEGPPLIAQVGHGNKTWNNPPAGREDVVYTNQNQSFTINVLDNDLDYENDTKSVYQASSLQAAHGTVVAKEDGTFSYTPHQDFCGRDVVNYRLQDRPGYTTSLFAPFETPVIIEVLCNYQELNAFDFVIVADKAETVAIHSLGDVHINQVTFKPLQSENRFIYDKKFNQRTYNVPNHNNIKEMKTVDYRICDKVNTKICDEATITVVSSDYAQEHGLVAGLEIENNIPQPTNPEIPQSDTDQGGSEVGEDAGTIPPSGGNDNTGSTPILKGNLGGKNVEYFNQTSLQDELGGGISYLVVGIGLPSCLESKTAFSDLDKNIQFQNQMNSLGAEFRWFSQGMHTTSYTKKNSRITAGNLQKTIQDLGLNNQGVFPHFALLDSAGEVVRQGGSHVGMIDEISNISSSGPVMGNGITAGMNTFESAGRTTQTPDTTVAPLIVKNHSLKDAPTLDPWSLLDSSAGTLDDRFSEHMKYVVVGISDGFCQECLDQMNQLNNSNVLHDSLDNEIQFVYISERSNYNGFVGEHLFVTNDNLLLVKNNLRSLSEHIPGYIILDNEKNIIWEGNDTMKLTQQTLILRQGIDAQKDTTLTDQLLGDASGSEGSMLGFNDAHNDVIGDQDSKETQPMIKGVTEQNIIVPDNNETTLIETDLDQHKIIRDDEGMDENIYALNEEAKEVSGTCGDGVVQKNEACDDGNNNQVDQCSFCQINITYCGDNVVQRPNAIGIREICDGTHGCSHDCQELYTQPGADMTHSVKTLLGSHSYGLLLSDDVYVGLTQNNKGMSTTHSSFSHESTLTQGIGGDVVVQANVFTRDNVLGDYIVLVDDTAGVTAYQVYKIVDEGDDVGMLSSQDVINELIVEYPNKQLKATYQASFNNLGSDIVTNTLTTAQKEKLKKTARDYQSKYSQEQWLNNLQIIEGQRGSRDKDDLVSHFWTYFLQENMQLIVGE